MLVEVRRSVRDMSAGELDGPRPDAEEAEVVVPPDIGALVPIIRQIVYSRVPDNPVAEDLVQETLAKVISAANRVEPGMLEPYAIATARNLIASMWRTKATHRRNQHRVVGVADIDAPDERMLKEEERAAVTAALQHLSEREQQTLLAHEVSGQDMRSLASELGSSAGAVAAQLHRTRARLRVEYLLALHGVEPPTDRCRAVLYAVSRADRRRQREVDAARHLLECDLCSELSPVLLQRRPQGDNEVIVRIQHDADVVKARKSARELASIELLDEPRPGIRIVSRDTGPGIPDVEQALTDGYSTYNGLGLGLPGARRLMDEFTLTSEPYPSRQRPRSTCQPQSAHDRHA